MPGYQESVTKLVRKIDLTKARELLRGDASTRALLIKDRLDEMTRLLDRISGLERLIKQKVLSSGTTLHAEKGLSFVLTATILGEAGDPGRIRSEGAFAMLNGTAPLEASSGKTKRHRLNRRGNRQLNYAIHAVALVRARSHDQSRQFMAKKRAEGKTNKEAMRCLKRHISNLIFRQMIRDLERSKAGVD